MPNTIGRATQSATLASIAEPWVEFTCVNAMPQFHPDLKLRPREYTNGTVGKSKSRGDAVGLGATLVRIASVYKEHCMLFRWVACAILREYEVGEVRPNRRYTLNGKLCGRYPAMQAIAHALSSWFTCDPSQEDYEFRTPLRLMVEVVYEQAQQAAPDEIALLYYLLVDSLGIPCRLTIDPRSGQVSVCGTMGRDPVTYAVFDPLAGELTETDRKPANMLNFQGQVGTNGGNGNYGLIKPTVNGHFPTSIARLIGTGRVEDTVHWSQPQNRQPWFTELNRVLRDTASQVGLIKKILISPVHTSTLHIVGENHGPKVTGATIALTVRVYVQHYRELLKQVVVHALNQAGIDGRRLSNYELAAAIADYVRACFPYAEETSGVEEVTTMLRALWFFNFQPGCPYFDCDDLTIFFMSLCEAVGLHTKIRLAGNAGENHQFHVYPLVVTGDREFVFDVSTPRPWSFEMARGTNKIDYEPRNPATFEQEIRQSARQAGVPPPVGGWVRFMI